MYYDELNENIVSNKHFHYFQKPRTWAHLNEVTLYMSTS